MVGDGEAVEFVPLRSSTRFPALQAKQINLLARNTTSQTWRQRQELPPTAITITITKPEFVAFAIIVLFVMIGPFLVGDSLPTRIVLPEVAIIGATLVGASANIVAVGICARGASG